ncbi:hypothetical protein [Streptomyces sp. 058-1L]
MRLTGPGIYSGLVDRGQVLSQKRFAQLEAELAKGPTARGWEDQHRAL